MGTKIAHAVCDENGKAGYEGSKLGNQTGKELRVEGWKYSNWNVLLICTDKALAKRASEIMLEICTNPNYGYSQPNRWTGYNSIMAHGVEISEGKGDFDCSSLCLTAYILAGLKIKPDGYTGNMRSKLVNTGKFKAYTSDRYIKTDAYAELGAMYLREGHHVNMVVELGETPAAKYFPKYTGKSGSIVDGLNSIGADSSFTYRNRIASKNGINKYTGTAEQNTSLLNLLKQGKLLVP